MYKGGNFFELIFISSIIGLLSYSVLLQAPRMSVLRDYRSRLGLSYLDKTFRIKGTYSMKKLALISLITATALLNGCSMLHHHKKDLSPQPVNPDDSFAMQILKAGSNPLGFNIKDAEVDKDNYYSSITTPSLVGLGLLDNGLKGGLSGLGWGMLLDDEDSISRDDVHLIAWVPVDSLEALSQEELQQHIFEVVYKPLLDDFINSKENKHSKYPTKFLKYENGIYWVTGGACIGPFDVDKKNLSRECALISNPSIKLVRYATTEVGTPFEPEVKAKRYIVVSADSPYFKTMLLLPHIKSKRVFAYVPAYKYSTQKEALLKVGGKVMTPYISKQPYVLRNNKHNYFIKIKK